MDLLRVQMAHLPTLLVAKKTWNLFAALQMRQMQHYLGEFLTSYSTVTGQEPPMSPGPHRMQSNIQTGTTLFRNMCYQKRLTQKFLEIPLLYLMILSCRSLTSKNNQ